MPGILISNMKNIKDEMEKFSPDVINATNNKSFPSGIEVGKMLFNSTDELLFDEKSKSFFNDFKRNGGKFVLANISSAAGYLDTTETIYISTKNLYNMINNDTYKDRLTKSLSHELHHSWANKQIKNKFPEVKKFLTDCDTGTIPIVHAGYEAGAFFHEIKTHFEAGGEKWKYYSSTKKFLPEKMEKILSKHNLSPGQKIPKDLLPVVGNLCIAAYALYPMENKNRIRGDAYQRVLLKKISNTDVTDNHIKKINIPAKDFFEAIGIPTTFSEDLLKRLLYFDKEIVSKFKLQSPKDIPHVAVSISSKSELIDETDQIILNDYRRGNNLKAVAVLDKKQH